MEEIIWLIDLLIFRLRYSFFVLFAVSFRLKIVLMTKQRQVNEIRVCCEKCGEFVDQLCYEKKKYCLFC